MLVQDGVLGGLKDTVQTADDGERQDDLAVLGLLVVPAQEVSHAPDEGGVVADRLALGAGRLGRCGCHERQGYALIAGLIHARRSDQSADGRSQGA